MPLEAVGVTEKRKVLSSESQIATQLKTESTANTTWLQQLHADIPIDPPQLQDS